MIDRLDELLIDSIRSPHMSISDYVRELKRPVIEPNSTAAAHKELLRIVRSWPDKDSPLSRCRILSVLRHLKFSLSLSEESFGTQMLNVVDSTIPAGVRHIALLHEMGFACFTSAFELYEHTLQAFYNEKGVELDIEYKQEVFQIYLLAIYHMGRSRSLETKHREVILFGVHDSYNTFFLKPSRREGLIPEQFVAAYESVVARWVKSARESHRQSPSYALVRTVFNLLGLVSPMERMNCAALLEAGAGQMLELSEVVQHSRLAVGV
ncbi:MAG: hypothetical protein KF799_06870 [Bdellovibrionales bacterium]|nr:hypothetical protein [Bdellovibrionales bacterium]